MESVLSPPKPFNFENNLMNVTSGNLCAEWEKWKKSFKIYFDACELGKKENQVQISILLHIIGDKCREIYEQFKSAPTSLNDLLQKFDRYFIPKKNLAVERHKFFKRDQQEDESAEQYIFELNKIAFKCEFKDLHDDLVCSRFVCGIKDMGLAERLLREPDISLQKALEISKLAEISHMQAINMKTQNQTEHHVHQISSCEEHERAEVNWLNRKHRQTYKRAHNSRTNDEQSAPAARQPAAPKRDTGSARRTSGETSNYALPARRASGFSSASPRRDRQSGNNCMKCGGGHRRYECPAFGQRCNRCGKMNHYARMCKGMIYHVKDNSTDQDSDSS